MNENPKPFDCSYSPQFAELLHKLKISLAISTYQAGKVIMVSSVDSDKLIQLTRTYKDAMGMAVSQNKLAIASFDEVTVLKNRPELAKSYPTKKNVYDAIYIPTARYNTGSLALHDMEFMNDKLVAVNTSFSCLSYIDSENSFTPFWQPPFITELQPEDRCHMNGLAVENNQIKYLTALGNTNTVQGWRNNKMVGGILMEYPSGKIILDRLAMPHSPRVFNGKLYVLNSAKGELICVDPTTGTYEVVVKLGAFARGMSLHGDYLFIGVSKLRHNSKAFSDLEIAKTSFSGIIAVYLPYKSIVGSLKYEMSVDEIYDVKVISNSLRPSLLSPDMEIHKKAITTPNGSFWALLPEEKQQLQNQSKFSFQKLKISKGKDLIKNFSPLIHGEFISELNRNAFNENLTAIVALTGGKAVAMTVFEITKERKAYIHSVFVMQAFRQQAIATNLLLQTEKIVTQNNIVEAQAIYDAKTHNAEIIKKLFNKSEIINLIPKE
ncbi:MAG: TIGR03032 family protein [Salinivirgaceae bacterium]|nr:TIGR03032 family protein [Salinivirgaceae bacterium]